MKKLVLIKTNGESVTLSFKKTKECINALNYLNLWCDNLDELAQINIIN